MNGLRSLGSAIGLALLGLRRNGLRASLTVLGIAIGIAAVIVITALGAGARDAVGAQIEVLGTNVIMVFPKSANASGSRMAAPPRLTLEDAQVIAQEATAVRHVAPSLRTEAQAIVGELNRTVAVLGTSVGYFDVRAWALRRGALWEPHDDQMKSRVCVIGAKVAEELFPGSDPVGRSVRIERHSYRVLGVLEAKGASMFGGDQDNVLLMPISTYQGRVVRGTPGVVGALFLSASSEEATERAVEQVQSILRQRHRIGDGMLDDFQVHSQAQLRELQETIYGVLTSLLVAVAGISLVVGGIGVMNVMLVSVTERTREIGVRMAIGAREGDVLLQFLVEAVVLSLLGGALGAGAGSALSAGVGYWLEWNATPSPLALAVGLGVSAAIGLGFGILPARRAARLDPIVALRRE